MNAVRWLAAAVGGLLLLAVGDVASREIRARLDQLPITVLRLARARLPVEFRERVHDQEWLPELEHILTRTEQFPLTRLITGLRYATGLLMRAGTVAAELQPPDAADGNAGWRRIAARSVGTLHTLLWPTQEPLRVRLYVAAVATAAAAATGVAAIGTTVHANNIELFAVLVVSGGLAAHRSPPKIKDQLIPNLMSLCLLPAAILLPPVYVLIAIFPLFVVAERRHCTKAYRWVFSAATNGLAYAAASELAHAVAHPIAGQAIPPGATLLTWVLVVAGCELLARMELIAFFLTAIKASMPTAHVIPLLADRTLVRYCLAELALGIAATFGAAVYPLLVILLIPIAIQLTRRLSAVSTLPAGH